MQNQIRIVSTKKLSERQEQQLLSADFSVYDKDFISIQNKDFEIEKLNDCLIFTSQNAVESVLRNNKIAVLKTKKCFCVGEKTKAQLEYNDFEVIEYSDYAAELASIIFNKYPKISFRFFCLNIRWDVGPVALLLAKITLF
jgi:uroporphyrinogen-III synthase